MKPNEQMAPAANLLATANKLLIAITVLLVIVIVLNALIYFNIVNMPDYVLSGFSAVYDRMGRMRVY